jgi:hypothetical protein
METQIVTLDRKKALELYRAYKTHAHYSTPIDHEIQRTYQLIAQGKMVIKALESIGAAGVNEQGWPKLAIMRADQEQCYFDTDYSGGGGTFQAQRWGRGPASLNLKVSIPGVPKERRETGIAIVPQCPLTHRPKRGLANYHILWEAEWTKIVPRDPYLLRRIGKADLWLVVHAWDLTEVERGAMATRIR